MTERPILFNDEMVRAILDGRKTVTRRPAVFEMYDGFNPDFSGYTPDHYNTADKSSPWVLYSMGGSCWHQRSKPLPCPFGVPGDRLWVRECFRAFDDGDTFFRADHPASIPVHADDDPDDWRWTPSIHMPRDASRITLEVTGVRVERVQEITEEGARSEGMSCRSDLAWGPRYGDSDPYRTAVQNGHRAHFRETWDAIYAPKGLGWGANPWVWVVEFRVLKPSEEQG